MWSTNLKKATLDNYRKASVGKSFEFEFVKSLHVYVITHETADRDIQLTSP